ncbi:MAG TPA: hypothetical protein VGG64_11145 [Pirellulales bacterium]|jgi:hypothetical protein
MNHILRHRFVHIVTACLALTLLLFVADTVSACPSCKAALANQDGHGGDLVTGFFYSILFMLSMPFAIFGSMSGYFYMLVRRARRQQVLPTPNADSTKVTAPK